MKYDTIRLKVIKAGKEFPDEKVYSYDRCGIVINGRDIRSYIVQAEKPFLKAARLPLEKDAGLAHMEAVELYDHLGGYTAFILTCAGCGEWICHGACCNITVYNNYVVWDNFKTIRDWQLGLKFKFRKKEYEKFEADVEKVRNKQLAQFEKDKAERLKVQEEKRKQEKAEQRKNGRICLLIVVIFYIFFMLLQYFCGR